MKFLITGVAGFIGYHTAIFLLKKNYKIVGIDNLNSYYDISLKKNRLKNLFKYKKFKFYKIDISNNKEISLFFLKQKFKRVIHLASQSGVQYSLKYPINCFKSNLIGYLNIIECCKNNNIKNFMYASSSSVYGKKNNNILSENSNTNYPISLYAATKKSNELIAHVYSHIYKMKTIGLRFFTVYGPWGRPDMAIFKFTDAILNRKKIKLYNYGKIFRDFTYIDDVIESIFKLQFVNNKSLYNIYNIGNCKPIKIIKCINIIEKILNKKAIKKFVKIKPGDMKLTHANIDFLKNSTNFIPKTNIKNGIKKFVQWYLKYYKY